MLFRSLAEAHDHLDDDYEQLSEQNMLDHNELLQSLIHGSGYDGGEIYDMDQNELWDRHYKDMSQEIIDRHFKDMSDVDMGTHLIEKELSSGSFAGHYKEPGGVNSEFEMFDSANEYVVESANEMDRMDTHLIEKEMSSGSFADHYKEPGGVRNFKICVVV